MNEITREEWIEMREDVTYIRTKLDVVVETQTDHETRIRDMEKWKWGLPVSVLAALAAFFGAN